MNRGPEAIGKNVRSQLINMYVCMYVCFRSSGNALLFTSLSTICTYPSLLSLSRQTALGFCCVFAFNADKSYPILSHFHWNQRWSLKLSFSVLLCFLNKLVCMFYRVENIFVIDSFCCWHTCTLYNRCELSAKSLFKGCIHRISVSFIQITPADYQHFLW